MKINQLVRMLVIIGLVSSNLPLFPSILRAEVTPMSSQVAVSVVNVNTASAEELVAVRGIGPKLAERIIQYRDQNGPFKSVEDLTQVSGIGSAKLNKIKDQVSI